MTVTEIRETPAAAVTEEATAAAHQDGTRPEGAAGDVWDALMAKPGATPAELSAVAGVSRATANRTLATLEKDGRAVRTLGGRDGGKRLPDRWALAPAMTSGDVENDAEAGTDASADSVPAPATPGDDAATDGTTEPGTDEGAPSDEPADPDAMDPDAVAEARDALTAMRDQIGAALEALASGDRTEATAATESAYAGSGKARRLVRTAVNGRPRNATGQARSNPGEMRSKVAAHLASHPTAELTPHEIGKVIGHSPGAIANALDRLVALGEAVQTCERPRRFIAVSDAEAPSAVG